LAQSPAASAALKIPSGVYNIVPDANYSGPDLAGIVFEFSGDTLMTVKQNGGTMISSKMAITGTDVMITDGDNQIGCTGTSKYQLKMEADAIRLVPVEDSCETRALVMPQVKLVKSGS
jgi:hypothetical protein